MALRRQVETIRVLTHEMGRKRKGEAVPGMHGAIDRIESIAFCALVLRSVGHGRVSSRRDFTTLLPDGATQTNPRGCSSLWDADAGQSQLACAHTASGRRYVVQSATILM